MSAPAASFRIPQPVQLPARLVETGVRMAPGVEIAGSDIIRSEVYPVTVGKRAVTIGAPYSRISDLRFADSATQALAEMGWQLSGWQLADNARGVGSAVWTPPRDVTKERIAHQTVTALCALSCLMPPGLPTRRSISIDVSALSTDAANEVPGAVATCDGLGIGPVHVWELNYGSLLNTAVPILMSASLFADPHRRSALAKTLVGYIAAVTDAGPTGGYYDFHLMVESEGLVEHAAAAASVRPFFAALQSDPRLASGAGWASQLAWYGGMLLAAVGLGQLGFSDTSAGFAETLPYWRTLADGALLAGATAVYRDRTNLRSGGWPAITAPFGLTVWPYVASDSGDSQSAFPSPLTLHRTQRGNGARVQAMQTRIEKTG